MNTRNMDIQKKMELIDLINCVDRAHKKRPLISSLFYHVAYAV